MTRRSSALLTPRAMAEADRLTIAAGTPGAVLMHRAGVAVADAVARATALGTRIVVLCGPGNNGGDGYVAARVLRERGFGVTVAASRPPQAPDAAAAAEAWGRAPVPLRDWAAGRPAVVVDALYGAGLSRAIAGVEADVVAAVNASGCRVVAADIASGIDGETGAVRGVAMMARETATFFRRKPGHLLMPGRLHCGTVRVADIGIRPAVLDGLAIRDFANDPALWCDHFPFPRADGHKYHRGHAVVVSGGLARTGAARLAARGALRVGAGLVTLASPPEALAVNASHLTAVMLERMDGPAGLAAILSDRRRNAVCLGPALGTGEATRALVAEALASGAATVIDADGLTAFAEEPSALFAGIRAWPGRPVVLTPHGGEFARLFGADPALSKPEAARRAAALSGAAVIFKGPDTVVAMPDGTVSIAANAPPWLATAGSGDVLAGIVTGLLAQGMAPFEAASAAVWLHGEAGQAAGLGLIAEDLPEVLPRVLGALAGRLAEAREADAADDD
ncbi:MAG: NAD(P)H-hydrate dehydratase [Phreatobacter sp.]|uniref:NAD(P)H-hydrate dehydratase n=1 Tax=Phreatobacter sp. TaxID=1966341 RepID=UPI00273609CE|nr:NAD(P)H-hydrate dehydratase [Phreatobacter sp.]MDP2802886.1 NAD(P)H-hydrate dehydratase [Phreatobacter sp.]